MIFQDFFLGFLLKNVAIDKRLLWVYTHNKGEE